MVNGNSFRISKKVFKTATNGVTEICDLQKITSQMQQRWLSKARTCEIQNIQKDNDKTIREGIEDYNRLTRRSLELLDDLVKSDVLDRCNVKTISSPLKNEDKK